MFANVWYKNSAVVCEDIPKVNQAQQKGTNS